VGGWVGVVRKPETALHETVFTSRGLLQGMLIYHSRAEQMQMGGFNQSS
jgi:hypothetical protein